MSDFAHFHHLFGGKLFLASLLICVIGSAVSIRLWEQLKPSCGILRIDWLFLAAFTTGTTIWSTHFLAMIDFQPGINYLIDPIPTITSFVIAVAGLMMALRLVPSQPRNFAILGAGSVMGLTIAAMHFVGVSAYRIDGHIDWNLWLVALAIILAVALGWIVIASVLRDHKPHYRAWTSAALVLTILTTHLTGVAAMKVIPAPGALVTEEMNSQLPLGIAVTLATLMIICIGLTTDTIRSRVAESSRVLLTAQALQDPLTGIANRRQFLNILQGRMREANADRPLGLMILDLDRFKPVNDGFGHPVGDEVLCRAVARIKQTLEDGDIVARMGGDEFCVLSRLGGGDYTGMSRKAGLIAELLGRPFVINGNVLDIGASVGVANAEQAGYDSEQIIKNADMALYEVKRTGRGTYLFFDPSIAQELDHRRRLEYELRRAVAREDFSLCFQPQVDSDTREYVGAEALIRWNHADFGMVPPDTFIPMAEEMGLINVIGKWVLRAACKAAVNWPNNLKVAVNLSPLQLADPRLGKIVIDILAETGLDPQRLDLEITETAIMLDDAQALKTLNILRKTGIRISLDDFGTGYSSLSHLHKFPIDTIKIDKAFIQQSSVDESSAQIVRVIAQMGAVLGMTVTAEGVETEVQRDFAGQHGCQKLQGYLTGKPMPDSEIRQLFGKKHESAA